MRTTLLLCVIIILLSSCFRYQYLTVASDHLKTNMKNEFVMENDTLVIIYNFHGQGGPFRVHIYNKSNEALQIDWKRSSLIIGDNPLTFFKPEMQIQGVVENNRRFGRYDNEVKGLITAKQGLEFIPPGSAIVREDMYLSPAFLDTAGLRYERVKQSDGQYTRIRTGNFSRLTSPFRFRSYLTFITGGPQPLEFTIDHFFYVSQLIDTDKLPSAIWLNSDDKGNEFYIEVESSGKAVPPGSYSRW
jgi:hypothetical protein